MIFYFLFLFRNKYYQGMATSLGSDVPQIYMIEIFSNCYVSPFKLNQLYTLINPRFLKISIVGKMGVGVVRGIASELIFSLPVSLGPTHPLPGFHKPSFFSVDSYFQLGCRLFGILSPFSFVNMTHATSHPLMRPSSI